MQIAPLQPFDAAPFARLLEEGLGLVWEDLREIHRVVVHFVGAPPENLQLEYWRTGWPQRRLPKDRVPGGGDVGWWELGNWYTGQWQPAAVERALEGSAVVLAFRAINETEFPELRDFPAAFRTTLKIRLQGAVASQVQGIEAFTDSALVQDSVRVLFAQAPCAEPSFEVYNGHLQSVTLEGPTAYRVELLRTENQDPNTFDRTLLTVRGDRVATVRVCDACHGPVCIPDLGIAVTRRGEDGDYTSVCSEALVVAPRGVYDTVAQLPEQTWRAAWANMVPKRARICLALATEGSRHKFRLGPDGGAVYRTNNALLSACPGQDTARLQADRAPLSLSFGLPEEPTERHIEEGVLPIGHSTWSVHSAEGRWEVEQTAFATVLPGTDPEGDPPPADALGVLMLQLRVRNPDASPVVARLALTCAAGDEPEATRLDGSGGLWSGDLLRALVDTRGSGTLEALEHGATYRVELAGGAEHAIVVEVPYVPPQDEEWDALNGLDFAAEHRAVAGYWRRRIGQGMRLHVPEEDLRDFHAAHATHLLINCEKEPESAHRFARVGSFHYAAYGNESCMMIVDLDRRGYHREARECLDAFLAYQGTVPLPGDFSSHEGVLYGAHGYEHGGYNQHHGWILWCLAEHYRFTRDGQWLAHAAPGILGGADWIVRERARTRDRADLGRGLLPHGSLEDIGDWWQWLSTNAYTWRGLDSAAWALAELSAKDSAWDGEARRVRQEADEYRQAMLRAFGEAAQRSPVVRLRDGVYVPHTPSHVHRRGRSFGWICETLEGAIHLLIAGLIPPDSQEALWILKDYEDNRYPSDAYGYGLEDFAREWFHWGGFSMQACLLLGVEPYLGRDDIPHALRATFNAIAANFFPEVRMIAEHALPHLGDYRGDHYKTSDEANATGWLRFLFVRESGDDLLLGQAVPLAWLQPGCRIGVEGAATYFGPMSLLYEPHEGGIVAKLSAPRRNPPGRIKLRFRHRHDQRIERVLVGGQAWPDVQGDWVVLPGDIGEVEVAVTLGG